MATIKERLDQAHKAERAIEEEIAAIYKESREAPEEEKICPDIMAEMLSEPHHNLQYPITVHGICDTGRKLVSTGSGRDPGTLVRIRPCDKECEGKTYLGLYLGDLALSATCAFNPQTGVLEVGHSFHNPAIWVPALKRIVFGCESWWGPIKSPEDMRDITDATINELPYVQAAKQVGISPVPLDPKSDEP